MFAIIETAIKHRQLILQISKREIYGRYKGSVFGVAWSFFNPILMLLVYTFVFSVIFQTKWGQGNGGKAEFAAMLFCGLIVSNLFGEIVGRAPQLIVSNANYVKKVVFPLEILTFVSIVTALFHACISIIVLVVALIFMGLDLHLTLLLFPVALFPFLVLMCGLSWIFAALGVYLRDVGQIVSILITIATFLSPVFYPLEAVPTKFVSYIILNPLTMVIEQFRDLVIRGRLFDVNEWGLYFVISLVIFYLGYNFFQKTRKGFSDVL